MSASSDGPAASPTAPPVAPAALEFGRWLFKQECRFLLGAVDLDHLPTPAAPEVAFAGRSNVGKSSLVNALTERKTWPAPPTPRGVRASLIFSTWAAAW